MSEQIRCHLDKHIDPDIARALRQHGIDVGATVEAGLRTASDPDQLAFVQRDGRVLVTHDADFLRLAAQGVDHPGIAYCHRSARSLGEIIRSLILIHEVLTPEEMAERVQYLQPDSSNAPTNSSISGPRLATSGRRIQSPLALDGLASIMESAGKA